jgi:hypothetical protein
VTAVEAALELQWSRLMDSRMMVGSKAFFSRR